MTSHVYITINLFNLCQQSFLPFYIYFLKCWHRLNEPSDHVSWINKYIFTLPNIVPFWLCFNIRSTAIQCLQLYIVLFFFLIFPSNVTFSVSFNLFYAYTCFFLFCRQCYRTFPCFSWSLVDVLTRIAPPPQFLYWIFQFTDFSQDYS